MQINDYRIKISKKAAFFIICDDIKVIYENEEISLLGDIFSFILGDDPQFCLFFYFCLLK
jgi:hypothetical protein